jgi:hypothetical protein
MTGKITVLPCCFTLIRKDPYASLRFASKMAFEVDWVCQTASISLDRTALQYPLEASAPFSL